MLNFPIIFASRSFSVASFEQFWRFYFKKRRNKIFRFEKGEQRETKFLAKSNLDKSLEYEAKLSSLFSIAESQRWKIKSERSRESMTERERERPCRS